MTTICTLSTTTNPIHAQRCNLFSKSHQPINFHILRCSKFGSFHQNWPKMELCAYRDKRVSFRIYKDVNFLGKQKLSKQKRLVLVRFNQGFNFNGGGGGNKDGGTTARLVVNLGLALGLTYLSFTGQLGWVLDTIVSLWLLSIIIPVVGFGAFLWWARQDMIQGTCPNCGQDFQVLKSTLNDELQLCPFCSQPFSVEGNEFVKEPIKFSSNRSNAFGQIFDDMPSWSRKGKDASKKVVDVEAEVKDAE